MSYITLDKEREIRIRNKAISQIEKRFKKPFIKIMSDFADIITEDWIYMLYVGLKHEDSTLTVDTVENLADEHANLTEIIEAVTDACYEAYGTDKEEAERLTQAENPQTAAAE